MDNASLDSNVARDSMALHTFTRIWTPIHIYKYGTLYMYEYMAPYTYMNIWHPIQTLHPYIYSNSFPYYSMLIWQYGIYYYK